jgi:hypothetical protein
MSVFEKASRLRIRFASPKGNLSVEDLWDLPLIVPGNDNCVSLDSIAIKLHKQLKEGAEESFVVKSIEPDTLLQLSMSIVKRIITVRMEEAAIAKDAAAKRIQKQTIMAAIANKQNEAINASSLEDLEKMLEDL